MGTVYLIRHGQASYGEADYDRLSARGETQARALGAWLSTLALDATFAGPLKRQQQTIAFARETAGIPEPTTIPELAEYPAFEMLQHLVPKLVAEDPKFAQIKGAPTPKLLDEAFQTILAKWSRDEWVVEGLERADAFVTRVRTGLERAVRSSLGGRIALVTSAGPIGAAVGMVFGASTERMIRTSIVVRNASVTELRFRSTEFAWHPDRVSLVTFNGTSHIPADLNTER